MGGGGGTSGWPTSSQALGVTNTPAAPLHAIVRQRQKVFHLRRMHYHYQSTRRLPRKQLNTPHRSGAFRVSTNSPNHCAPPETLGHMRPEDKLERCHPGGRAPPARHTVLPHPAPLSPRSCSPTPISPNHRAGDFCAPPAHLQLQIEPIASARTWASVTAYKLWRRLVVGLQHACTIPDSPQTAATRSRKDPPGPPGGAPRFWPLFVPKAVSTAVTWGIMRSTEDSHRRS